MKRKNDIGCFICRKPFKKTDDYMVHDSVWQQSGLPSRLPQVFVSAHIECLERRIGRKLEYEDFTDCEINRINKRR